MFQMLILGQRATCSSVKTDHLYMYVQHSINKVITYYSSQKPHTDNPTLQRFTVSYWLMPWYNFLSTNHTHHKQTPLEPESDCLLLFVSVKGGQNLASVSGWDNENKHASVCLQNVSAGRG